MFSNINILSNEITKFTIALFNQNNLNLDEYCLQKVIYQIKMNLGSNHPLYNQIPYYWYFYGPFSETISTSFQLTKRYLDVGEEKFFLNDYFVDEFKNVEFIKKYPEFEYELNNILSNGYYIYEDLSEDIYKKYSPFDMLHTFKYGIFNPTESAIFQLDSNEYILKFQKCLESLKLINYNPFYINSFSKITSHLVDLNANDEIKEKWVDVRYTIRDLWFCFAKGLRIKSHDIYYNNEIDKWKTQFMMSIIDLDNEIEKMIRITNDNLDSYHGFTFKDLVEKSLKNVKFKNKNEIISFIDTHPGVMEFIDKSMPIVEKYFPDYPYELEFYRDPEYVDEVSLDLDIICGDSISDEETDIYSKMLQELVNIEGYRSNMNSNLFSIYLG